MARPARVPSLIRGQRRLRVSRSAYLVGAVTIETGGGSVSAELVPAPMNALEILSQLRLVTRPTTLARGEASCALWALDVMRAVTVDTDGRLGFA